MCGSCKLPAPPDEDGDDDDDHNDDDGDGVAEAPLRINTVNQGRWSIKSSHLYDKSVSRILLRSELDTASYPICRIEPTDLLKRLATNWRTDWTQDCPPTG